MPPSRRACLSSILALGLGLRPGAPRAQTAPAIGGGSGGRVILRVTGRIAEAHGPEGAGFDLAALEALGLEELTTRTPWTGAGALRLAGLGLARLLDAVGAAGTALRATALNDYAVTIPVADARENGAFLATRLDGRPMRVRDKGPVWMVYPWSARPDLDVATYHERAIWQLRQIEVR